MKREAISLGVSALIVTVLIIVVGFGVYLNGTFNTSSTVTSSSSISSRVITTSSGIGVAPSYHLVDTKGSIFLFNEIPYSFVVGNFTINLVNNGTGYKTLPANGTATVFLGFVFAFNITNPIGKTTNIFFLWSPPCNINYGLPCQTQNEWTVPNYENDPNQGNATINYLQANLSVSWFTNSTGLFASFQELDEIQNVIPTTSISGNQTLYSTSSTYATTSSLPASKSLIVLDLSNGSAACQNIREGQEFSANWSGNVCTLNGSDNISSFALKPGVTLEILPGVTLILNDGGFGNYGTIINNGTMEVQTSFTSYGVIVNSGQISTNASIVTIIDSYFMPNGGTLENYGVFSINGHVGYYQHNETFANGTTYITAGDENLTGGSFANGGILDNYGTINNTGWFWNGESGLDFNSAINNFGTIRNLEYAKFVNYYTITNNGTIVNSGNFANNGTIVTYCGSNFVEAGAGTYSGSAVIGACSTTFQTSTTIKEENNST